MSIQANVNDINIFLEEAKKLISVGRYDFVPRRKNMQALAKHGFTIADAKEELLGLVVDDYYKGPKQDFDCQGVVWEFKKEAAGIQFYIKIKIVRDGGEDILRCLSFHEDEFA